MDKYTAQFKCQPWHPLTELPISSRESKPEAPTTTKVPTPDVRKTETRNNNPNDKIDIFANLSSNANKVSYNAVFKPELSTNERIKELKMSARSFENAKDELVTKGLAIESNASKKKYLMPKPEVFEAVGLACPYKNIKFVEHSFFMHVAGLKLSNKPSNQTVTLEYKIGTSGHTADIVTTSYNGVLTAYEMTLSASNILQNCLKYDGTAFVKIIFLCRNTDLMKAAKSTVLKAGVSLELIGKIEFILVGSILK